MKLWRPRPTSTDATARRGLTGPDRKKAVEEAIPLPVEIAGQWAWRILAVVAVLVLFGFLIISLRAIVVPFLLALLIAALLVPLKSFLIRHRWPKWLAVLVALVLAVVIIAGLVFIVVWQVRNGLPALEKKTIAAYDTFKTFLAAPPFNVTQTEYNAFVGKIAKDVQASPALATSAGTVVNTIGHLATGLLLTIFATVFLVLDGAAVWRFVVRLFPRRARVAMDGAGQTGWRTLTAFIRVQLVVAAVDAIVIGLGAFILHLPLAIPIAIVVFLASFVPVVGAVVSGAFAVVIALIYYGPIVAVIMLGIVLLTHILEGNFLHPFITGSAVKLHPLAIVFVVAAGAFVAGIPGALFAVPVVAVVNVMVGYLVRGEWKPGFRTQTKDVVAGE